MTEREREEILFKRAEDREYAKKQFEIRKKLKQKEKFKVKNKEIGNYSNLWHIWTLDGVFDNFLENSLNFVYKLNFHFDDIFYIYTIENWNFTFENAAFCLHF